MQFPKAKKNKVPSSVDGAVSLSTDTQRETEREGGAGGERNTERHPLFKIAVFVWGMGR